MTGSTSARANPTAVISSAAYLASLVSGWDADARFREALIDDLAAHGLTIDSPMTVLPEGTIVCIRDVIAAARPRPS